MCVILTTLVHALGQTLNGSTELEVKIRNYIILYTRLLTVTKYNG